MVVVRYNLAITGLFPNPLIRELRLCVLWGAWSVEGGGATGHSNIFCSVVGEAWRWWLW